MIWKKTTGILLQKRRREAYFRLGRGQGRPFPELEKNDQEKARTGLMGRGLQAGGGSMPGLRDNELGEHEEQKEGWVDGGG